MILQQPHLLHHHPVGFGEVARFTRQRGILVRVFPALGKRYDMIDRRIASGNLLMANRTRPLIAAVEHIERNVFNKCGEFPRPAILAVATATVSIFRVSCIPFAFTIVHGLLILAKPLAVDKPIDALPFFYSLDIGGPIDSGFFAKLLTARFSIPPALFQNPLAIGLMIGPFFGLDRVTVFSLILALICSLAFGAPIAISVGSASVDREVVKAFDLATRRTALVSFGQICVIVALRHVVYLNYTMCLGAAGWSQSPCRFKPYHAIVPYLKASLKCLFSPVYGEMAA